MAAATPSVAWLNLLPPEPTTQFLCTHSPEAAACQNSRRWPGQPEVLVFRTWRPSLALEARLQQPNEIISLKQNQRPSNLIQFQLHAQFLRPSRQFRRGCRILRAAKATQLASLGQRGKGGQHGADRWLFP